MDVIVGKPPINKDGVFRVYGEVSNVSMNGGVVIEIPSFKSVCTITRVCVAGVDNSLNESMLVELFDKDPSGTIKRWNKIYHQTFDDTSQTDNAIDDIIQHLYYMSEDGSDRIWLKITPENGTSNKFEYFIFGKEDVRA